MADAGDSPSTGDKKFRWYVVQTFSSFENKVRESLLERAKREGLESSIGKVMVPTEEATTMVGGKKRSVKRKFFPSYILVEMEMNDRTWRLVKDTPKVSGFVGGIAGTYALYKNPAASGYSDEVVDELEKVTWPSKQETQTATTVVIVATLAMAVVIFVFDWIWSALTGVIYQ